MNGATIGMEVTPVVGKPILKVLTMGRVACFVAAVGNAMRGAVVLLSATTIALTASPTTLGSACPFNSYNKDWCVYWSTRSTRRLWLLISNFLFLGKILFGGSSGLWWWWIWRIGWRGRGSGAGN